MGKQIKIIIAAFIITCRALVTIGQAQDDFVLTQYLHPEIQDIIDRGYLIVAMFKEDVPPFFMKDRHGNFVGLDVEIARKIAESLGVGIKFHRESRTFDQVVDTVAQGEADIGISKLSYTTARSMRVLLSNPYIILKKTLLINRVLYARLKGTIGANTLEELFKSKDGTICVLGGSSYEHYAREIFPQSTVVPLRSWEGEIIPYILEGKALAAFRDDLESKKFFLLNPKANLIVRAIIIKDQTDPIHMAIQPSKYFFQQWVNKFIEREYSNVTVEWLMDKYGEHFRYMQ
jgi:polar amino acid transport system substrate-binding protein